MPNPDFEIGQKVWKEGRPHRTKPNWFSAYGNIIDINYADESDTDSEVVSVNVLFDDDTVDEIDAGELDIWDDVKETWNIFQ
jgi:hypothetical protein